MTPKEYLSRYRNLNIEIDSKTRQLEKLREQATRIVPEPSDGIPGSGSTSDRLGNAVAKICDLEAEIEAEISRLVELREEIRAAISRVQDSTYRNLLELRYIEGMTFERIAVEMNYSWRQVIRIHGSALYRIKDVIECHT